MNHQQQNRFNITISSVLFGLIMSALLFTSSLVAQTNQDCETNLVQAEKMYYEANFDKAIDLLKGCIDNPRVSEATKSKAYRLLSLSYLAKDYEVQAKSAIKKLLEANPNYRPQADEELPEFVEMVEKVRQEISDAREPDQRREELVSRTQPRNEPLPVEEGGGKGKWLLIGGGVVAAGVAVALLAGGGGDGDGDGDPGVFPNPPARP